MSYYKSKELREQRANIAQQMAELITNAKKEERSLNAEEQQKFDRMDQDQKKYLEEAEGYERMEKFESETLEEKRSHKSNLILPQRAERTNSNDNFRAWLMHPYRGAHGIKSDDAIFRNAEANGINLSNKSVTIPLRQHAPKNLVECRDLSNADGTSGLNVVPDEAMLGLERALLQFGGMRQVSRVIRTNSGAPLPIPNLNDTANVGGWISEGTSDGTTDTSYGQTVLNAYTASSDIIRVSVELVQDSSFDMASHLGSVLGERIGRLSNTAYTVGDGTAKPTGIVGAAAEGHQSDSTNDFDWTDLVDLQHSADAAYRVPGQTYFMMHDSSLANIRTEVDDQSRPIWVPSVQVGQPDTIFGYPVIVNNDLAEITDGSGSKVVLFGNFQSYLIRDVLDVTILRSDHRYFEARQIAFCAFLRTDGAKSCLVIGKSL